MIWTSFFSSTYQTLFSWHKSSMVRCFKCRCRYSDFHLFSNLSKQQLQNKKYSMIESITWDSQSVSFNEREINKNWIFYQMRLWQSENIVCIKQYLIKTRMKHSIQSERMCDVLENSLCILKSCANICEWQKKRKKIIWVDVSVVTLFRKKWIRISNNFSSSKNNRNS